MSEMIERVARAMCIKCDSRDPDDIDGGYHPLGQQLDKGEPWWTGYIEAAHAAIEAMREPAPKMIDACGNGECAKWAPGA